MPTITRQRASELISEAGGRIFTVKFRKRSNNQVRVMTCRTGVKKFLTGGSKRKFDPQRHRLLNVAEIVPPRERDNTDDPMQYRCIPYEGIIGLKIDGVEYTVNDIAAKMSQDQ